MVVVEKSISEFIVEVEILYLGLEDTVFYYITADFDLNDTVFDKELIFNKKVESVKNSLIYSIENKTLVDFYIEEYDEDISKNEKKLLVLDGSKIMSFVITMGDYKF